MVRVLMRGTINPDSIMDRIVYREVHTIKRETILDIATWFEQVRWLSDTELRKTFGAPAVAYMLENNMLKVFPQGPARHTFEGQRELRRREPLRIQHYGFQTSPGRTLKKEEKRGLI